MQVQQARVEGYTIQVPLRLCQNDKTSLDSVFALVRQFHPQPDMLTAKTKMFTFESSEWTALNLQHLASQGNSYILLGEAGVQILSSIVLCGHNGDVHMRF